jgi:hypothetical protein
MTRSHFTSEIGKASFLMIAPFPLPFISIGLLDNDFFRRKVKTSHYRKTDVLRVGREVRVGFLCVWGFSPTGMVRCSRAAPAKKVKPLLNPDLCLGLGLRKESGGRSRSNRFHCGFIERLFQRRKGELTGQTHTSPESSKHLRNCNLNTEKDRHCVRSLYPIVV